MDKTKTRFCFNCGQEIGAYGGWDQFDTCGAKECDWAARDALSQEQADAHEKLDRDMGW